MSYRKKTPHHNAIVKGYSLCEQAPVLVLFAVFISTHSIAKVNQVTPSVTVFQDHLNTVILEKNRQKIAVYGLPEPSTDAVESVLLTHNRRDAIKNFDALHNVNVIVPKTELIYFTKTDSIWSNFWHTRFHDYGQQSVKIPVCPVKISRAVTEGDAIKWKNISIRVLDTPGFTRGAVSYETWIDGKKIIFAGDLLYGDGQIFDIYSLQDRITGLDIRGYHGYAARAGQLLSSLEKISARKPDIIIPARGPVIDMPEKTIPKLTGRLQRLYKNYLSTSAFRWFTGREKQDKLARRMSLAPDSVPWMPYARTMDTRVPDWLIRIHNTRLLRAKDGTAFLIDCGAKSARDSLMVLFNSGKLKRLDGIFISHYHDDHLTFINELQAGFSCPIYICRELEDILQHPAAYRMPAMTETPIKKTTAVDDGHSIRWKEFKLSFYYFPGQTIYHGALFAEHNRGGKILFVGDSFSPSGMDDYCLQNRNLFHPDKGYFYCLDFLAQLPQDVWLVNQHVFPPFRFTAGQIHFMQQQLKERETILTALLPWDNPNYGVDEQWAGFYPYGQKADEKIIFNVRITNHHNVAKKYRIKLKSRSEKFSFSPQSRHITIAPGKAAKAAFSGITTEHAGPGYEIVTADINFDEWYLYDWCETIIKIP